MRNKLVPLLTLFLVAVTITNVADTAMAADPHQYYEVRCYVLGNKGDGAAVQSYLTEALLPALARQAIGPVGVFKNSAADESGSDRVVVVIPYESADQIAQVVANIQSDAQYQSDAKDYLERGPGNAPYQRISSELLVSMDCMKELKVPAGTLDNAERVYELRVYESGNERLGNLKVDMFNSGEVPIFLDSGIQPIFIGQALVGPQTPNLTYLTMYPSEKARNEAWVAFRNHPDWQVLSKEKKYQGTVSRIDKYVLVPTDDSQM
jgi:hypothetical protein